MSTTSIDFTIGLPPMDHGFEKEANAIKNSMPIARIYPKVPEFITSLATFTLKKGTRYFELLNSHGFSVNGDHISLAFIADSFPTDNFQNNYSESFLQNVSSGISQGMSTLIQSIGGRTGTDAAMKSMHAMSQIFKELGMDNTSSMISSLGSKAGAIGNKIHNLAIQHDNSKSTYSKLLQGLNAVAGGARFDFPMIWTDSSFQPSYTMTVRLYNPDPGDDEITEKYIIGPLAAILLLGLPISDDKTGSTYNYPFLHEIQCDGIYFLNPCFISNISVIKGGDQQQIAFNQKLAMVDVRIDFGSLFSSMLATDKDNYTRPTLKTYLAAMKNGKRLINDLSDEDFYVEGNIQPTFKNLWSDPFNPLSAEKIDNLPKNISDDVNEMEYNIINSLVTDLGSLSKVVEKGYTVPNNIISELYKNRAITDSDILSVFPTFDLPNIPQTTPNLLKNVTKSSLSLFSGLGASASALVSNVADINGLQKQLTEIINTTSGNILPPIIFDGEVIGTNLTKFQANKLIETLQNKKESILGTVESALGRMGSEISNLQNFTSTFNNISGVTNFLTKHLNFSSITDLMDKLKPGNIISNASGILKDMISSGLNFNTNNMFKGIINSVTDQFGHMDILKTIISKGIEFPNKNNIINMIKNGVNFDPKKILLDIASQEIDFRSNGILNTLMNGNVSFNATDVLRSVIEPGVSFKSSLMQLTDYKGMINDLKNAAIDEGINIAVDLSNDLVHYVKDNILKTGDNMNVPVTDTLCDTDILLANESDKSKNSTIYTIEKSTAETIIV